MIKEDPFEVEVEFEGWAAAYVSERKWSAGQKFRKKRNGAVVLKFKTASALEVISWMLSFRDGCSMLKPKWLIEEFEATLGRISKKYS